MSTQKYSIDSYYDFLEVLPTLDVIGENTIKNLKTVPRILSMADSNLTDIRKLDADEVLKAFEERNEGVSKTTLQSYRSRIMQALKLFVAFVDSPEGFTQEKVMKLTQQRASRTMKNPSPLRQDETITFTVPVPLRNNLTTIIDRLPRDLTVDEAERICTIIRAFAIQIPDPNELI
ncbi:hypothetical protein ACTZGI_04925 [Rahnella aceris]|uniref:hypothetical protein n=1 Tax=Rahnella sp. (strain Y9602) TaxID=2703885 RepID=UPI003FD5C14E